MTFSAHHQTASAKKSFFAELRRLRAEGQLTPTQVLALQRMIALGQRVRRSYAALAAWCQVSRATIGRVLAVAERLGLLVRHSKQHRYWDEKGARVRVVRDIVTLSFLRTSSKSHNAPDTRSLITLNALLAPHVPLDGPLATALRRLQEGLEHREERRRLKSAY